MMPKQLNDTNELISLGEREFLVRSTLNFNTWSVGEVATLVGLMKEVTVKPGAVIVAEGDVIDSIYLLAQGTAEVSKAVPLEGKIGVSFVAVINQGEWIGLSTTHLYSETGVRSATVTSSIFCILLRIDLTDLNQFFKEKPHLLQSMGSSLSRALKAKLIKESAPFAQLNSQQIAWMANLVKEVDFEPQSIVFNQGDASDSCYMVYEGRVEILQRLPNGQENTLAILESGSFFGEGALLAESTRNATARALTACKLLVLDRDLLQEFKTQNMAASNTLLSLLEERNQPIRHDNILHQHSTMADGEVITTLKNPIENTYCQLNAQEWFIWGQLNGVLTPPEIAQLIYNKFGTFNLDLILSTVQMLTDKGFAYLDVRNKDYKGKKNAEYRARASLTDKVTWVHFLKNPNQVATKMYKYGGAWLVNLPMMACFLLMMLLGFVLFPLSTHKVLDQFKDVLLLPVWVVGAISLSMLFGLLNPIVKALLIKKIGHDIPHMALIWQGVGPKLYVNTNDLLMGPARYRILICLSGIMFDLAMAGLLSLSVYLMKSEAMAPLYWLTALFLYLKTLRSLDPMLDLDGYFLLMESLQLKNLRQQAFNTLIQPLSVVQPKSHSVKKGWAIFIFWMACLCYLCANLLVVAVFFNSLSQYWVQLKSFMVPCYIFVIVAFLLEILVEYQSQKKVAPILRDELI